MATSEARKRIEAQAKPRGMMTSEARKRLEKPVKIITFRCNTPTQEVPEERPSNIISYQRSF